VVFSRIHDRQAIIEPLSKTSGGKDRGFLSFEDNDLAVEWCEDRLFCTTTPPPDSVTSLADFPLFRGISAPLLEQVETVTCTQGYAAEE